MSLAGNAILVLPYAELLGGLIRLGNTEKIFEVAPKVIWGQESKTTYCFRRRLSPIKKDHSSKIRETLLPQAHFSWKSCRDDPFQLMPSL